MSPSVAFKSVGSRRLLQLAEQLVFIWNDTAFKWTVIRSDEWRRDGNG